MPSYPEIPSLTQAPPAAAAAQKILAAYLSNHRLPPVAAAQLAVTLTALLKALVDGRDPAAAGLPRFVMPAAVPAAAPRDDADDAGEDEFAEDEIDAAEDEPLSADASEPEETEAMEEPEPAPRARRGAKTKVKPASTASKVAATKPAGRRQAKQEAAAPEPAAPEPAAPEPVKSRSKKTVTASAPAQKPATTRRGKKAEAIEPAISEPAAPEQPDAPEPAVPAKAASRGARRKPKSVVESQALFDLDTAPDAAPEPGAVESAMPEPAPEPAVQELAVPEPAAPEGPPVTTEDEAVAEASDATAEPAISEPAAPEPAAPQPAAPQPPAPRPILRAVVRAPVVEEDEDYDPYLGGPMPSSAAPMAAPAQAHGPEGAQTMRKKRKRPSRPAAQRRAARLANGNLDSGATPANGGVPDDDDDYDPLI